MPDTSPTYRAIVRAATAGRSVVRTILTQNRRRPSRAPQRGSRRFDEWARDSHRDPARPLVWFHASSVGEGLQAEQRARRSCADSVPIASSSTPTSARPPSLWRAVSPWTPPDTCPTICPRRRRAARSAAPRSSRLLEARPLARAGDPCRRARGDGGHRRRYRVGRKRAASVARATAARARAMRASRPPARSRRPMRLDSRGSACPPRRSASSATRGSIAWPQRVRADRCRTIPFSASAGVRPPWWRAPPGPRTRRCSSMRSPASARPRPDARLIVVPHEPTPEHLAASTRGPPRAGLPAPVRLSQATGPAPLLVVDRRRRAGDAVRRAARWRTSAADSGGRACTRCWSRRPGASRWRSARAGSTAGTRSCSSRPGRRRAGRATGTSCGGSWGNGLDRDESATGGAGQPCAGNGASAGWARRDGRRRCWTSLFRHDPLERHRARARSGRP